MTSIEYEVKNEVGAVIMRTEDRKAAEDKQTTTPGSMMEEKKYYMETEQPQNKLFQEVM